MCGRFAISHIPGLFARFMIHDPEFEIQPRYNIAPTQDVPVILLGNSRRITLMKWGLVPFWAKTPKIGSRLINARSETIAKTPAFRASVKRRRCLVPATGFYEWRDVDGRKMPYYCHLRNDSFFAFAGLYDRWKMPDGTDLMTFTLVTTTPNALIENLHNRMPVILREEHEQAWISNQPLDATELKGIVAPYPASRMEIYRVSLAVGDPRNESEDLIRPLATTR